MVMSNVRVSRNQELRNPLAPLVIASGAAAAALASLEILRALTGRGFLPEPVPGTMMMPLGSAVGNLLLAVSLVLLGCAGRSRHVRAGVATVAVVLLLASALSLFLHVRETRVGWPFAWLTETRPIGAFVGQLLSVALLLSAVNRRLAIANVIAVVLLAIGAALLLGFLYGGPLLPASRWPQVNLAASLITTCLAFGIVSANGSLQWPTSLFVGTTVSAMLFRWFLPFVALAVLLTDVATINLFRPFSPAIGSVVNTMVSIAIAALLTLYIGRIIDGRIQRSTIELRALSTRLNSIREQERARIARDVHDHLGQALTALRMDVAELRRRMDRGDVAAVAARLGEMNALIDTATDDVRRVASELRPPLVDDIGIVEAIKTYAADFCRRVPLRLTVRLDGEAVAVSEDQAIALFRILQEALTNVARHAGASHVGVALACMNGVVQLEVRDDGRGLPPEQERSRRALGIVGMRDRARFLGGDLTVSSMPGRGTTVTAHIPIAEVAG
jgi:signal transduction histidine kinase